MDTREVACGVILAIGVALLLYGLSMPEFTGEVRVEGPIDGSTVDEDRVTEYGELSDQERRVFDRALSGDGTTSYDDPRWTPEVVAHDGEYYRTSLSGGDGAKILRIAAGLAVIVLGVLSFAVVRVWKRWSRWRADAPPS